MKHEAFDLYEGVNMFSTDRITMREKGEVGGTATAPHTELEWSQSSYYFIQLGTI